MYPGRADYLRVNAVPRLSVRLPVYSGECYVLQRRVVLRRRGDRGPAWPDLRGFRAGHFGYASTDGTGGRGDLRALPGQPCHQRVHAPPGSVPLRQQHRDERIGEPGPSRSGARAPAPSPGPGSRRPCGRCRQCDTSRTITCQSNCSPHSGQQYPPRESPRPPQSWADAVIPPSRPRTRPPLPALRPRSRVPEPSPPSSPSPAVPVPGCDLSDDRPNSICWKTARSARGRSKLSHLLGVLRPQPRVLLAQLSSQVRHLLIRREGRSQHSTSRSGASASSESGTTPTAAVTSHSKHPQQPQITHRAPACRTPRRSWMPTPRHTIAEYLRIRGRPPRLS